MAEAALLNLAIGGLATSAAGTVFQVLGARSQAKFQKEVADQNAEIERQNAEAEASALSLQRRRQSASTFAGFGASGAGSPLSIEVDQAIESEFDRKTVLAGGQLRSREQKIAGISAVQRGRAGVLQGILSGTSDFAQGAVKIGVAENAGVFG